MRRFHLLAGAVAAGGLCMAGAVAVAQSRSQPDVAAQMGLKPGRWHTVGRILAAKATPTTDKPVPPDFEAHLRSKIGQLIETDDCIAPRKPNEDLKLPGISIGASCALSDVVMSKQALKLHASCGNYAIVDVKTTHTATTMTSDIESLASPNGVPLTLAVTMRGESRYVGPCS